MWWGVKKWEIKKTSIFLHTNSKKLLSLFPVCENTTKQDKRKRLAYLSEKFIFRGRGEHTIRLNFPNNTVFIENCQQLGSFWDNCYKSGPLLFPSNFSDGYRLRDIRKSKKGSGILIRRIKLCDGNVYSVIPCSQMPCFRSKDISELKLGKFLSTKLGK